MLHVILLILKILGIILLIAAGLLLLALYAVLFMAVSYRIRAKREDTFQMSASAAWLFRIVTIHFSLDERTGWSPVLQIRLFGCPRWRILGEEEEKDTRRQRKKCRFRFRKKRRQKMQKLELEDGDQEVKVPEHVQNLPISGTDPEETVQAEPEQRDTGFQKEQDEEHTEERVPKSRKPSFFSRLFQKAAGICRNIRGKVRRIKKNAAGIRRRIRRLGDRKDAFLEFWNLEEHRRARGALFSEGKYLWKKSRPKKIRGQITFGFSDPSHTGLCMGAVGILCAWYPGQLRIVPDFEREILKGDILVRGRIRCYIFVRILLRIYFNKDIRHMYQHWQEL